MFLNRTDTCDRLRMRRPDLVLNQSEKRIPRIVGRIWLLSEVGEIKRRHKLYELILRKDWLRGHEDPVKI